MQLGQFQDAVNAQTTAAHMAENMQTGHNMRMKRFLAEFQNTLDKAVSKNSGPLIS
ncbi:hypothetical protein [Bowmanella sp. JS7-9]|uniref:Phasin protein n=1 Tax=Pseudobowmanella zhangzhouensis TaxID=1537679 RepID=A0ABW1XNQ4_9ALTE|nr:hypothetical protein [Bowmanella sp. JS7-9]